MKTKLHFIENETNVELLEMFSQRNRSVCTIAVKQQSLNFCIFFLYIQSPRGCFLILERGCNRCGLSLVQNDLQCNCS